jgi:hypothetical protein
MKDEDLQNVFTYHAPFGNQAERYSRMRAAGLTLARTINTECPESREKSLAITAIQQAIQWANAAIAINEKEKVSEG